jgi:isocitrate/isopropylmalate dehydrogenase
MLDHLGLHSESEQVMTALEAVCADPATRTRDIGGKATTVEFGDAVMAALEHPTTQSAPTGDTSET